MRLSIEGWPGAAGLVAGVAALESPGASDRPQAARRQAKVKVKAEVKAKVKGDDERWALSDEPAAHCSTF
jgi:hypothetical protein